MPQAVFDRPGGLKHSADLDRIAVYYDQMPENRESSHRPTSNFLAKLEPQRRAGKFKSIHTKLNAKQQLAELPHGTYFPRINLAKCDTYFF